MSRLFYKYAVKVVVLIVALKYFDSYFHKYVAKHKKVTHI